MVPWMGVSWRGPLEVSSVLGPLDGGSLQDAPLRVSNGGGQLESVTGVGPLEGVPWMGFFGGGPLVETEGRGLLLWAALRGSPGGGSPGAPPPWFLHVWVP
jgi:hypothetical protein